MLWTILGVLLLYPVGKQWFKWTIRAKHNDSWLIYPLGIVMLVLDVAFNWIYGTMIFGEFPKEFLFSTRVKRHYRTCEFDKDGEPLPVTEQQYEAVYWADWLNEIDPGHITPYKG